MSTESTVLERIVALGFYDRRDLAGRTKIVGVDLPDGDPLIHRLCGDLICIRPPYERLWIEYEDCGCVVNDRGDTVDFTIYVSLPNYFTAVGAKMSVACDEAGKPPKSYPGMAVDKIVYHAARARIGDIDGYEPEDIARLCFRVCLMNTAITLSLLHCKNIKPVDQRANRAQRRRATKANLGPVAKILTVQPIGRKAQRPNTGKSERLTRLHLVRGHFATYSEAAPLFGKLVGTFWVSSHVRGDERIGSVRKAYRPEPPAHEAVTMQ